jgi:crotonobetainyl-CoA:carnitine CoA-transferase CaiB-like acyl-CoA transferase
MRAKPLAGIRVLDLTRLLPGPVCTLHLADLGADVIKIEDTGAGDYARTLGTDGTREAPVFLAINRNKRGLRLDLKQAEGRAIFLKLVERSHVVVEGFRPGVMDRLKVGYAACRTANPAVVFCSISGYGQDGPFQDKAGHDINYISYAGVLDQIGAAGGAPTLLNFQIADILGGAVVPAMTILATLLEAQRSGQGRAIDVSMTDAVFAHNYQALAAVVQQGAPNPRGQDLLSGREPCYGVYGCADGRHMAVGALEKKFWDRLCEVVGREDLKACHWDLSPAARTRTSSWGRAELERIFASQPQSHWVEKFRDEDCCVTPIPSMDEAMRDPLVQARQMVRHADSERSGKVTQFSTPFKLTEFELDLSRPAPAAGEHSAVILEELGYAQPEIERLRSARVI